MTEVITIAIIVLISVLIGFALGRVTRDLDE